MKIIIASGNKGKIKEFKSLMPNDEVIPFKDIVGDMDIIEDGDSFKANAIIKAKAIYEKLDNKNDVIVISDDSGISVPALNNEPGIYSARYARSGASDKENNQKLIDELNKNNLSKTPAYYTACIAIAFNEQIYTVHGWMHGDVLNTEIGDGGFGYDPMFIPDGYTQTLGELDDEIKKEFSHRSRALKLAKKVLDIIL